MCFNLNNHKVLLTHSDPVMLSNIFCCSTFPNSVVVFPHSLSKTKQQQQRGVKLESSRQDASEATFVLNRVGGNRKREKDQH